MQDALTRVLHAAGPAPDLAERMGLYAWLIGSWELDVIGYLDDGTERRRPGEWHFGWVLEGRAIQDVWIVPARRARQPGADRAAQFWGMTLRVYDPRTDTWRIAWSNPASQTYATMIGRRAGEDIVQDGRDADGNPVRWSFSEIAPASFRWRGEVSKDGGATWRLRSEFFARRADAV